MSPLIIDLLILAFLVIFAWLGAKKGLVLTVFSLLALFVAFFGAREISSRFADPVADIIRPSIQLTIDGILEGETPQGAAEQAAPEESGDGEGEPAITRDFSLRQILTLLEEHGEYEGFQEYLDEAIRDNAVKVTGSTASAVASYLAGIIATAILFGASFVLILLVWSLASRALDLAFKLPILSAINSVGGLILGLVKGVVVVLVLVWLAKLAGWITEANTGPITAMMTVEKLSAFLRSVIAGTYVP